LTQLIFIHGIGAGAGFFDAQVEEFRARPAFAWNLPGYGGTWGVDEIDIAGLTERLAAYLDAMAAPKADIFGHSLGGMVALELAATQPQRVRGLVLANTTPVFGSRDGKFEEAFIRTRLGPLEAGHSMAEVAGPTMKAMFAEDADPMMVKRAADMMAEAPADAYKTSVKAMLGFNRLDDLESISVPALVIAGENDPAAPAKSMEKMASKMPHAEFHVVPGGHMSPMEQADEVNRLTKAFLEKLDG